MVSTADLNDTVIKTELPPRKTMDVKPPVAKKERTRIRKRVNTAEKRASHNAVERQRRETLNSKFLDLARLLPTLASLRRPSKSSIVNASISHLNHQREQRLLASRELRALFSTNEALLAEVNEWRSRNGMQTKSVAGWTETCEEIIGVENEVFGTFNEVGGQGDEGDDDDEGEMDGDASVSQKYEQQYAAMNNDLDDAAVMAATVAAVSSHPSTAFGSFSHTASISAGSHRSPVDLHSFANPPAFRSMPINSQPRMSFAPQIYADSAALNSQRGMNTFLADTYDQHSMHSVPSQHSPIGGSGSVAGSNGDGVVTPPPMIHGEARHGVSTFVESPSASGVAATSFSLAQNNGGDKVSDWAAQQLMLQFGQQSVGMEGCSPFDQSGNDARSYFQQQYPVNMFGSDNRKVPSPGSMSGRHQANLLPSTQQSLMIAQPHLAAAVFPPATSASPPSSFLGGGDVYNAASMMGVAAFEQGSPVSHHPQVNATAAAHAQQQIVQAASGLGLTKDQMEHWKRFAMDSFLNAQAQAQAQQQQQQHPSLQRANSSQQHVPTMNELRDAVRAGMSVGMGLSWHGHDGLEGFA